MSFKFFLNSAKSPRDIARWSSNWSLGSGLCHNSITVLHSFSFLHKLDITSLIHTPIPIPIHQYFITAENTRELEGKGMGSRSRKAKWKKIECMGGNKEIGNQGRERRKHNEQSTGRNKGENGEKVKRDRRRKRERRTKGGE